MAQNCPFMSLKNAADETMSFQGLGKFSSLSGRLKVTCPASGRQMALGPDDLGSFGSKATVERHPMTSSFDHHSSSLGAIQEQSDGEEEHERGLGNQNSFQATRHGSEPIRFPDSESCYNSARSISQERTSKPGSMRSFSIAGSTNGIEVRMDASSRYSYKLQIPWTMLTQIKISDVVLTGIYRRKKPAEGI